MTAYDLTHPLHDGVPVYPGTPEPGFTTVRTVPEHGALMTDIHCWSHVGTHVDAPAHMIDGGAGTFDLPLESWMGLAAVLRLPHPGPGAIEPENLTDVMAAGRGVLLATGHAGSWGTEAYYAGAPYLSVAAAEHLRELDVRFIGIDFPSPDPVGATDQQAHQILLGAGIPIIENLTGLDRLPAPEVWFCAAPLLAGAGDGGPCRAFALADQPGPVPARSQQSRTQPRRS
ncbi:cyclase family protein [Nonomuraea insulae]|uniref:Cyclase family protein n=1 Tax=Nonomuraea insulae TaxID=1616787 RepID=A0ABW1CFY1_9ACTN